MALENSGSSVDRVCRDCDAAGVLQVNVPIPAGLHGAVPLQLQIGNSGMPKPVQIFVQ
jgi:hypothetical protein